jgi:hypothetical protein
VKWLRDERERQRAREERHLRFGRMNDAREWEPRSGHPGEYVAKIEHPPDYLSPDQIDIFDWLEVADWPGAGGPFLDAGFQIVCMLELGEWPSDDAVRAELALRTPTEPMEMQLGLFG